MKPRRIALSLTVALFGFTAGSGAHADALQIDQSPLFLVPPVQPALIMAVDDSGSMDFEILVDANDGALWWNRDRDSFTGLGTNSSGTGDVEAPNTINFNTDGNANSTWQKYAYLFPNGTGTDGRSLNDGDNAHFAVPPIPQFAFARSPEFNAIYFNPAVEYPPWPSEGTATFTDASPTAAKADPVRGSQTWDLTSPWRSDIDNWTFRFQDEMAIPPGTFIKDAPLDNCSSLAGTAFDDWLEVPIGEAVVINEIGESSCNIAVEYFPATFWLSAGTPLPAGFGFIPAKALLGGKAPDGTEMVGYEIKPDHFSSLAQYNDAIQQFANWFQYYRKRVHLTRAAIGRSFNDVEFLRVGFFRINNHATASVAMQNLTEPVDRNTFFDWQYGLTASGDTPNRQAVKQIGTQFDTIIGDNAPILEACQRNFGMLVTDGFSNQWEGAAVGNTDGKTGSPLAGTVLADSVSETMADIAYSFYNTRLRGDDFASGKVPTPTACDQNNPPLTLDCVEDPHMNLFSVTLGARGLIFGRDQETVDDPFNNPPDWPTTFPARHPNSVDDLWHGTLNTRGSMFTATRPDELVEALTSVLVDISSRIQPVGISASASRIDEQSKFFVADLDSSTWTGNLRAFNAADNSPAWSAENKLPNPVDRTILTTIGTNVLDFDTGNAALKTAMFGELSTLSDAEKNDIIDYLRGTRAKEENAGNGGKLRERAGRIGDIANSRPAFSGPRNEGWGRLDASYLDYLIDKQARKSLIMVGANAGMLHGFDGDTGVEQFAYVPSMLHARLPQLADPNYEHKFFVDGQIGIADAKLGLAGGSHGWNTVAVGGLGGGGRGVYALDISNAGSFGSADVLWELDSSDDSDIGHVYDKPIITRLGTGQWVAIFANGFNSDDDQAHLFIVDLATGTNITKVALGNAGGNGLSSSAAFLDPGTREYVSRVYAGDLLGNMWRVDFDAAGNAKSFFGAKPLANVSRPIVAPPTLAPNPGGGLMVFFGTGKLIETADRVDPRPELETFWSMRDENSDLGTNPANGLAEAKISLSTGGQRVITSTEDTSDGWFMELGVGGSATGERVLSRPQVVFGQLIFSTFEPLDDLCSPGGQRRIYVLDAVSGVGLLDNQCENCGVVDVGEGAPVDPAIILRPPSLIGGGGGGEGDDPTLPDLPTSDDVGGLEGWCSEIMMLIPEEGFVPIGRLCDGRQVWRQAR
ncbi:MAG: PilC/PilY family type IV pilus protein [Wenzhouxiangellaceae bacterium]|nr:PilC/PilY family type IV pilus protein [Wenzhouxiangellaceae bacterium]